MSNTWVTADHHFGHTNIIEFCERPFKDADHMDTEMINRWCEVVAPNDTVYYLGNISLASHRFVRAIAGRLTGHIEYIPGLDHERWLHNSVTSWENDPLFTRFTIRPVIHEIKHRGYHITLSHYAMRSWPRSFHGSLHLFGHSHGRLPKYGYSMDVGVDTNDFYPYRLDDVVALLSKEEKHGD